MLAACLTASCSRQESSWQRAERTATIAAYQEYLEEFPAGTHAVAARARILRLRETEAWARAERLRTPEAWQRYLGDWPDGQHAATARRWLIDFVPPGPRPLGAAYAVQLGAYSTEDAARADRARLVNLHPAELAAAGTRIVAPNQAAGSLWRLRTNALAEDAARDLCARLRSGGVDCVPLPDDSAGDPPP